VSAQNKTGGTRARERVTTWSAWGMLVLALVLILLLQLVLALPHPQLLGIQTHGNSPFAFLGAFAFSIVGALIVTRRPTHPIGWIFCAAGLLVAMTAFTTAYSQYAEMVPGVLPAGSKANAVAGFSFFAGFLLPITFGLLFFPDGHLPSRRWLPVAWLTAIGFVLVFVGNGLGAHPALSDFGDTLSAFGGIALLASVVASAASLILRWRRTHGDERQQLKWVGSAAAILMVVFPSDIIASILFPSWNESSLFFIIATLIYALIPIAAGIAILKYRLYEIDFLINRTLVYVPLTAILAGVFAASISLTQRFFIALTGQTSDAATVLTTLIVVAAIDPLKSGLQHLVESRFKEGSDPIRKLKAFNQEVKSVVQVFNIEQISRRFLDEVTAAYDASGGAISLDGEGQQARNYTVGAWDGKAKLELSLDYDGKRFGRVQLGARRNGLEYTIEDARTLKENAQLIAAAVALAVRTNGVSR
jgi:hypothetical protein